MALSVVVIGGCVTIGQGVELLVHLDGVSGPQSDGWSALKALAASSSVVITEEMPVSPYAQWTQVRRPCCAA
jgi:hypothetical protein